MYRVLQVQDLGVQSTAGTGPRGYRVLQDLEGKSTASTVHWYTEYCRYMNSGYTDYCRYSTLGYRVGKVQGLKVQSIAATGPTGYRVLKEPGVMSIAGT